MIARIPPPTTVVDLERYSEANPGWQLEREADGTITLTPIGTEASLRSTVLSSLVYAFANRHGGVAFDASTGFTMPDGAILSPDCSWMLDERWRRLSERERNSFAPIVPNVCVEIVLWSQHFDAVVDKARRYRAFGADFALVLDPRDGRTWSDGIAPTGFPTDFSRVLGDVSRKAT